MIRLINLNLVNGLMGRWKSNKDGTHFKTGTTIRSSEPSTEVNIEIDNDSDDFSEERKKEMLREIEILKAKPDNELMEQYTRKLRNFNEIWGLTYDYDDNKIFATLKGFPEIDEEKYLDLGLHITDRYTSVDGRNTILELQPFEMYDELQERANAEFQDHLNDLDQ